MKNSRKMRGLLVMLIAFAFCFLAEPVKADDRTALDGIYVEDISVGGMTEEQITQAVNDKIEQLKPSVINLSAGEQNAQVTAGDLGLSCANPEVAREAVTIGQEGNVLKRFLTQNRLKKGETVTFSLKYTVDGEAARQAVENNTAVLNREATDATLTRENGEFIVNPGQTGCSVNVDESTAKVVNYLTTSWRGGHRRRRTGNRRNTGRRQSGAACTCQRSARRGYDGVWQRYERQKTECRSRRRED